MPRKSKENQENVLETKKVSKAKVSTTSNNKTNSVLKTTDVNKLSSEKKAKADSSSTSISKTKRNTKSTVASKSSKTDTKATTRKKVKESASASKELSNKKSASKKSNSSKISKKTKTKNLVVNEVEYYDLPYRYNETVVKILAQTPTTLFIYWDISDDDRKKYIEKYGEDFFNSTKPVLIITNKTMNYTFEIEINDFANSWYLHVNDPYCDYSIELGRRPINNFENIVSYIYVATSNEIETPNNHILFDKLGKHVFFKNVKNNIVSQKDISSISFIKNLGKYSIYDLYKDLYRDSLNIEELEGRNSRLNLSSSNSSTFK